MIGSPPLTGAILFFYYDDLGAAAAWYRDVLGLEEVMAEDWLVLLRLHPGCTIGLIDSTGGSQRPIPGTNKGSMLSIETDHLDAWHVRCKALGVCPPDTPLKLGCNGRTEEFAVRDPGGYLVEFFRWLDPPG